MWGRRGGVLRCSTDTQDKGRFAYVRCKFPCSGNILKYTALTLHKFQGGPALHLPPLHSTGTGDKSSQEHQVQRGANWMKPYAKGWMRKRFSLTTVSQQLSVNLFVCSAASGAVTLALVRLPSCPLRCPPPRERDSVWGRSRLPGNQANTGASASGFTGAPNPALHFPVLLNFLNKAKAIIFPTLHR